MDETDPDPVATQPLPPELERLTKDQAEALRKLEPCKHCGGRHSRACPRVKSMSFHPNATLAQVVFWRDGQWSDEHVIWPEDLEAVDGDT